MVSYGYSTLPLLFCIYVDIYECTNIRWIVLNEHRAHIPSLGIIWIHAHQLILAPYFLLTLCCHWVIEMANLLCLHCSSSRFLSFFNNAWRPCILLLFLRFHLGTTPLLYFAFGTNPRRIDVGPLHLVFNVWFIFPYFPSPCSHKGLHVHVYVKLHAYIPHDSRVGEMIEKSYILIVWLVCVVVDTLNLIKLTI